MIRALLQLIPLGLLAAVAALTTVIAAKNREEAALRDDLNTALQCQAAVAGVGDPAGLCPPAVIAVARRATAAAACDQALLEANLFAVRASCSTEVKTLLGQRDAESVRADSLADTLQAERADRAAAITRAEIRARTEAERNARAAAAIAAAPRDGAGHVVLDAERLRQLADAAGPAAD